MEIRHEMESTYWGEGLRTKHETRAFWQGSFQDLLLEDTNYTKNDHNSSITYNTCSYILSNRKYFPVASAAVIETPNPINSAD